LIPSVGEGVAEDDVELLVTAMLVPSTELRMEELEESTDDEDAARVKLELETASEVVVTREDAVTMRDEELDFVLLKMKDERLEVWKEGLALLE
jgi:3-hydroxy-3-methylglutaryl CoA synthase